VVDIYLQHGWGWDAAGWAGWCQAEGFFQACRIADRGYFGSPVVAEFGAGGILVVHSLGLHLVPAALFKTASLVAVFGGFQAFHPDQETAARRSRRLVQRMLQRLEREPGGLLDEFYTAAYAPQASGRTAPASPVQALLHQDLVLLDGHVFDPGLLRHARQVLIVHGRQDRIVPLEKSYALHCQISGSIFHVLEAGGHALPFTHGAVCRALIEEAFREGND